MNLKGRNFLKLMDFTPEEITYMIDLAADLKAKKKQGIPHNSSILCIAINLNFPAKTPKQPSRPADAVALIATQIGIKSFFCFFSW